MASSRSVSLRSDGDAPGKAADRYRLRDPQPLRVDDRNVVRGPIRREEKLLVGREGELPDALPDEQVALDLVGLAVDNRDAVRRPKRHEGAPSILRHAHADRLDGVLVDARNRELDRLDDLAGGGIDHGDRTADLRRDPELLAV